MKDMVRDGCFGRLHGHEQCALRPTLLCHASKGDLDGGVILYPDGAIARLSPVSRTKCKKGSLV